MTKFKIGAQVRFQRRNGELATGRVAGSDRRVNGVWVSVNTARKGQNAKLTSVRPVNLTRV
jgi:hypothetical protein